MKAMLMWKIHMIRATVLRSNADQHSEPSKIEIPAGTGPAEVKVWFFSLYDSVAQDDLDTFCENLG